MGVEIKDEVGACSMHGIDERCIYSVCVKHEEQRDVSVDGMILKYMLC